MQITQLSLKNFRAFKDTEMRNIPKFVVLVGANGTGKSTLFSVFGFLKEAMQSNVTTALAKLGGSRGFQEVRSRNSVGPIEIELKFREAEGKPLISYFLSITLKGDIPVVLRESVGTSESSEPLMSYDIANDGVHFGGSYIRGPGREAQWMFDQGVSKKKSPDLLAIKGLSQFTNFPEIATLGNLIEQWHVSDFHISRSRPEQEIAYAEHLSSEGENLSLVIEYLYNRHREVFDTIIAKLKVRIPGITHIESKKTEEGRILLKFQDGAFEDPFLARYVSDGTIKMLAYLVLLHDPKPHPLLCVEEPENQLYPQLLEELAEEFRAYANQGGQVFVSSHSPDFLNAIELDEVFWLTKEGGYTQVHRAKDNEQVAAYMAEGDKMGYLWKQGFFTGADPR